MSILDSIARLAFERPRALLLAWGALVVPLIALGVGVEDRLQRTSLEMPGTASQQATELSRRHFGESHPLVVLLRGDQALADRQGRRLADAFERHEGVSVLGPWLPGTGHALRPAPEQSLLIVSAGGSSEYVSRNTVEPLRDDLEHVIKPPLRANLTGYADLANGIHAASVEAVQRAELIAAPFLLLVLLLVFRSPIAAALPLVMGGAAIGAGAGLLELLRHVMLLDAVALNLMSMMGLALGVDYALLMVSRFRQELAGGASEREAIATAVTTAGRTVFFAGLAIGCAMTVAFLVAPGRIFASGSLGVVGGALMSVLGALIALPAVLAMLGGRIDLWRFGSPAGANGRLGASATRALRRPARAAALVLALVAVLAAPALALETGPPDPGVLPDDSQERRDYEVIRQVVGRGWGAPYQVTVAARQGRITEGSRMAMLEGWQRRLAARRDVKAVLGPAQVAERTESVENVPARLEKAGELLNRGRRDQTRLADGLARAGAGVEKLTRGLGQAEEAAGRIEDGAGAASGGAEVLQRRLQQAGSGSRSLAAGMTTARRGAATLARGAAKASQAIRRIREGLDLASSRTREALPNVEALASGLEQGGGDLGALREAVQTAEASLQVAADGLEAMPSSSKALPSYARTFEGVGTAAAALSGRHPLTGEPVVSGYDGLDAELAEASARTLEAAKLARDSLAGVESLAAGLTRLRDGSTRLEAGLIRLQGGLTRITSGLDELGSGGGELDSGLDRLAAGGGTLADGAERLRAGTSSLGQGLAAGLPRSRTLEDGVRRMRRGVLAAKADLAKQSDQLAGTRRLADVAKSGYFLLAALDTARPAQRTASSLAINTNHGGSAAQLLVVPSGNPVRRGHPLRTVLEEDVARLERATGTVAGVGGPAAALQDFDSASYESLPSLVGALVIVTYLILVPVLRSIVLPLLAVILNLLSVAAAFGVLVLLFQGAAPLGGPGFLDTVMVAGIFTVVFGLSIDYEVFLLTRIREGYKLTGDTDAAIAYGLRHTAGIITGAALIMTGVFIAFALTEVASLRQLGVGLTVAVLFDATLIRLLLLPAAIKLCGRANWWFPSIGAPRRAATASAQGVLFELGSRRSSPSHVARLRNRFN